MKKILKFLIRLLPHLILILSLMILTFFVIDCFNEAMDFLNNRATKILAAILAFCAGISALCRILGKGE